ncbi:LytR/AlgR family response regulator transcription factor [Woodsholea maritima]|uniref:LytR/AlgR family response regulator transcription factor n=1 Tax=Woodsholea maritima TaxID=240237 RepID=UPI00037DC722|nr:LytTR family DNA-binding domain-containing protein [Woodsholea maritima]
MGAHTQEIFRLIKAEWTLKNIALLGGYWLLTVFSFAFAFYIDALRNEYQGGYSPILQGFALGFMPWLIFAIPLFFRASHLFKNPKPLALIVAISSGYFVLIFALIVLYASIVFGAMRAQGFLGFIQSTRLQDWMWDFAMFGFVYLAGCVHGLKQRVEVIKTARDQMLEQFDDPIRYLHTHPHSNLEMNSHIHVRHNDHSERITISDILAVSSQANYVALITAEREILHRSTLTKIMKDLVDQGFFRIHRSHIVRLNAIKTLQGGRHPHALTLTSGHTFPVSARYRLGLLNALTSST